MRKDRNSLNYNRSIIVKKENEINQTESLNQGVEKSALISNIHGAEESNKKHYLLTIYELYVFRTVVCSSHLQGKCKNSDSCPFSHCLTWQRRNPNDHYYSPKLCPEICFVKSNEKMNLIRRCKKGKLCTFAHSKEEQLYHPLMYKTKECSLYPNCNRYYCPFSHGIEQIRAPEKVRESIEEVVKNNSQGILKNPYLLLSSIAETGNKSSNDIRINKHKKSYLDVTKNKKDTFLMSIQQNSRLNDNKINRNQELEEKDINSIWYSVDSWNLNAPNINFHPAFMEIMSFNEQDQRFINPDFDPCSFRNIAPENKLETDYDQIWKEISTEYNNKKL
ncbi:Zinc finger C-x8-C-x5-C-x3-H type (and similar) family protein [Cryptosporidium meleagridis]|uniref:Zinc finger C-x8-C-x5-C-x3-H type (And similar) family protein n=1 Tax=Cryptosporidium meleagridis TaxID=93969 RepID=A0A2P4Z5X6_9CRYT|nr:Zinc finger C-x8-C-x5-C-x3-H type (and similar) family protein [Cryptosporidium meleagridis]